MKPEGEIINDVSGLNPVRVRAVAAPASIDELTDALAKSTGPVSIGGTRSSMGGQTASPGSLHIDMRRLDRVLSVSPQERQIRVQAGARWCDIQSSIDPHDLAVKNMPEDTGVTVGGTLSANAHGSHIGRGPVIESVRSLTVVLADGEVKQASPADDPDLFYGIIGGYGGLGIIVEAELDLDDNRRLLRVASRLPVSEYPDYFRSMRSDPRGAVYHCAELEPPHFERARTTTWLTTTRPVTQSKRLRAPGARDGFDPFGFLRATRVHWRNYEAGRHVAWKAQAGRAIEALQEYFVPVVRFDEFVAAMGEILRRYRVEVINVTVRHVAADAGSLLSRARHEVLAFRLHYRQEVSGRAKETVAVWTRELIDLSLDCGGTFSLSYQVHATPDQFHRGYPKARQFFAVKRWLDPLFRLRNAIWDSYYAHFLDDGRARMNPSPGSQFHAIFSDARSRDGFYRYLQNVDNRWPEDRVQEIISSGCVQNADDEGIYRHIAKSLPRIDTSFKTLRHARRSLGTQKLTMVRQTLELLAGKSPIRGYVEIGSRGEYIALLRRRTHVEAPIILIDEVQARGRLGKIERFLPLSDYAPIVPYDIPDSSVDVVTCHAGLHHAPPERRDGFVRSLWRILRPGGLLILREHDVTTPAMKAFVSLAHTVFNASSGVSWEENREERRHFASVEETSLYLGARGFRDAGKRLFQANDPSVNVLMKFVRTDTLSQRAGGTAAVDDPYGA